MPYLTTAQVRALPNLGDTAKYPDTAITDAVGWFETTFEDATGVAWIPRTVTETLSGRGGAALLLSYMFPRTIAAVSITTNGVATAFTAAELADLVVYDTGEIFRLTLGRWPFGNRNVSVTYTHSITTTPPADVIEAAKVAVRERLLEGAVGNRQFSIATEDGIIRNSTPSNGRAFGIPFVDEVVTRRSHKVPGVA